MVNSKNLFCYQGKSSCKGLLNGLLSQKRGYPRPEIKGLDNILQNRRGLSKGWRKRVLIINFNFRSNRQLSEKSKLFKRHIFNISVWRYF